jgi:Co/Zn/Cd efflux system component
MEWIMLVVLAVLGLLAAFAGLGLLADLLQEEENRNWRTAGLCAACLFFGSMELGYVASVLVK